MDSQIDLYKTILYNYRNFINIKKYNRSNRSVYYISNDNDLINMPKDITHICFLTYLNLKKGDIHEGITNINFQYFGCNDFDYQIIPKSVTHLKFGHICRVNRELKPGDIPNGVIYLTLGNAFNQPLKPGDIPDSVTHLKFGDDFNQQLKPGDIPDSVTHLTFGFNFNQPLKPGDIPNNVQYLIFGYGFRRPLKPGDIPNSVQYLKFIGYNQPLKKGDIPESVAYLDFRNFDQPLKQGDIPHNVKYLGFNCYFRQKLSADILPKNIIEIQVELYSDDQQNNNGDVYYAIKDILNKNNILICYHIEYELTLKYNNNFTIDLENKYYIHKYIQKYLTKDKLIGNIIYNELNERVLNPSRLQNICNQYNITMDQLMNCY